MRINEEDPKIIAERFCKRFYDMAKAEREVGIIKEFPDIDFDLKGIKMNESKRYMCKFIRKDDWYCQSGLIALNEEEYKKVKEQLQNDDCEYLMFESLEIKHENLYEILKKFGINRKIPRGCWIDPNDGEVDLDRARKIRKELGEKK